MRLLVAEHDASLATFLSNGFGAEHYAVDLTQDGEGAKAMVANNEYDLAILDLNLSQAQGMEVLQHCRNKRQQLPILILTGRNRLEERVEAYDLGADDLVLKPFSFAELSARVRALLRRGARAEETVLRMDNLELNRVEHSVRRAGRPIELTPKEFGLLEYLMRNASHHVTRSQIIEHVWNLSFDTMTNVVDVYINYLRVGIEVKLLEVEQLPFREFISRLPEGPYVAPVLFLALEERAVVQLDLRLLLPVIDLLLGGNGRDATDPRELTEIEEQVLETLFSLVCREIQIAWHPVLPVQLQAENRLKQSQIPKAIELEDRTLLLNFEIVLNDVHGLLNFVLPSTISNQLIRRLGPQGGPPRRLVRKGLNGPLRERLLNCEFTTELHLPNLALRIRDVTNLQPETILRLGHPADQALSFSVNGHALFGGVPVSCGTSRGALLQEKAMTVNLKDFKPA